MPANRLSRMPSLHFAPRRCLFLSPPASDIKGEPRSLRLERRITPGRRVSAAH
jgi:hypothetical protein